MARLDNLEFVITAQTTALRSDLAKGTALVDKFTRDTQRSFLSFDNRITQTAGKLRSMFALFGVSFGVRAFAGWIKSATELDKLTRSQAEGLKGLQSAMESMNTATDDLAQTVALKLAPALERAALFWRKALFPTEGEEASKALDNARKRVGETAKEIADLRDGKFYFGNKTVRMEELGAELLVRQKILAVLEASAEAVEKTEKTIGQEEWDKKLAQLQEISGAPVKTTGLDKFPDLRQFEQSQLETIDAHKFITKQPGDLQNFDFQGAADQIERMGDAMKDAQDRAKEFATAFSASFESRGIQALLDGDIHGALRGLIDDFAEMVLRLTILKPLAEGGAFAGFGGGSGSTSIWANMFGGRASGGPVSAGTPYWVGERGERELFVPDTAGRIMTANQARGAGGGGAVNVHVNVSVPVGLEPYADMLRAASGPIQSAAMAGVMKALNRPTHA